MHVTSWLILTTRASACCIDYALKCISTKAIAAQSYYRLMHVELILTLVTNTCTGQDRALRMRTTSLSLLIFAWLRVMVTPSLSRLSRGRSSGGKIRS